jgi:hypothetical protein
VKKDEPPSQKDIGKEIIEMMRLDLTLRDLVREVESLSVLGPKFVKKLRQESFEVKELAVQYIINSATSMNADQLL